MNKSVTPVAAEVVGLLRQYAERYETADFIVGDPSWWMHQVSGADNQEAVAFVASCLSYGSRKQFMPKIGELIEMAQGDMDGWIRNGLFRSYFAPDDGDCFYRLNNKGCMCLFFSAYQAMLQEYGTMGNYLRPRVSDGYGAVEGICSFFAGRCSGIVPKDAQSACKRVCMFLRWMVRDGSPVDLGPWSAFIDRGTLIMPLDTHVMGQSVRLGLLSSSATSMSVARRLTQAMSDIFPGDPLKGDFALFGYGVNND